MSAYFARISNRRLARPFLMFVFVPGPCVRYEAPQKVELGFLAPILFVVLSILAIL